MEFVRCREAELMRFCSVCSSNHCPHNPQGDVKHRGMVWCGVVALWSSVLCSDLEPTKKALRRKMSRRRWRVQSKHLPAPPKFTHSPTQLVTSNCLHCRDCHWAVVGLLIEPSTIALDKRAELVTPNWSKEGILAACSCHPVIARRGSRL